MWRKWAILITCVLEHISCQSTINDEGIISEKFHSKSMYTITMSIDPTRIQVTAILGIYIYI